MCSVQHSTCAVLGAASLLRMLLNHVYLHEHGTWTTIHACTAQCTRTLLISVLPKLNSRHDGKGMVYVEAVATLKHMDNSYSHTKGNPILKAC